MLDAHPVLFSTLELECELGGTGYGNVVHCRRNGGLEMIELSKGGCNGLSERNKNVVECRAVRSGE